MKKVGLPVDKVLLGTEIEDMSDEELAAVAEETTIFAKLSPEQKAHYSFTKKRKDTRLVTWATVSMMRHPKKVADVGISVDSAVDIAKEVADVVLLDKDLLVLEKRLIEGRKVYANMTKIH